MTVWSMMPLRPVNALHTPNLRHYLPGLIFSTSTVVPWSASVQPQGDHGNTHLLIHAGLARW